MSLARPAACRLVLLALAPIVFGACATVGGFEPPTATPGPAEETLEPATESGAENGTPDDDASRIRAGVVEVALASIGSPYEWGGTDANGFDCSGANGFDCSGLIQFAYGKFGIVLPRVSTAQIQTGSRIDLEPSLLRPGDVLGFSLDNPDKTSHVGLYVGNNEFIHSSSSGVRISNLENPYWIEHLVAARRMVE